MGVYILKLMRKLLVISNDMEARGAKPGPHLFRAGHEEKIRVAVDKQLDVIVATPEEAPPHFADAEIVAAFPMRIPEISQIPKAK